ncbi:MAG: RluA family pseudouridine synthase [Candidatus Eisenbacteria bacterium]|nr:RluA family pseudouridine synthase [Candidatus Eisenbacteria bacterium]
MSESPGLKGEVKALRVPDGEPVRLDVFLAERGVVPSRAFGQRLIREGRVLVDGKPCRPGRALRGGERVEAEVPAPQPSRLEPEAIPLDVRYEDDDLVVVNKPAGMVVHPGVGVHEGTLVQALLHHCGALADLGGDTRPGIVHRLDKLTSGLLVAAKTRESYVGLAAAIRDREVERRYQAVVWGGTPEEGTIEASLGRSKKDRRKIAVLAEGKRALSRFTTRERFRYASWIEVRLETGRTHQIRVHFAHTGHPVFGDPVYGGRRKALRGIASDRRRSAARALARIDRQALHAWRLRFRHPRTGEALSFTAEPPEDMRGLLAFLREDDRAPGGAGDRTGNDFLTSRRESK